MFLQMNPEEKEYVKGFLNNMEYRLLFTICEALSPDKDNIPKILLECLREIGVSAIDAQKFLVSFGKKVQALDDVEEKRSVAIDDEILRAIRREQEEEL